MPLVRTPMIAPTKIYQNVPTLSPEEAGDLIVQAIVYNRANRDTAWRVRACAHALAPRVAQIVMNTTFRMFPDSDASRARKKGEDQGHRGSDCLRQFNARYSLLARRRDLWPRRDEAAVRRRWSVVH